MAYTDVYPTNVGDTWDLISYLVYGDEKHMRDLMKANPDYRKTTIFMSEVQLVCPDIDVAQSASLPPWET